MTKERKSKVKKIKDLVKIIEELKKDGKTIVQAHGIFDLVHPAHIFHFEQAKKIGDILVVSTVEDKFVQKGPGRPIFPQNMRAHWLAAFSMVDYVTFCGDIGPWEVIKKIKPNFYVKGESCRAFLKDPNSYLNKDKEIIESVGGKLCFTKELPIHSTNIFKQILINF